MRGVFYHAWERFKGMVKSWPLSIGVAGLLTTFAVIRVDVSGLYFVSGALQFAVALGLLQFARGHREIFGKKWPMQALPLSPRARMMGEGIASLATLGIIGAFSAGVLMAVLQASEWGEALLVVGRWAIGTVPLIFLGSITLYKASPRESAWWMAAMAAGQGVALRFLSVGWNECLLVAGVNLMIVWSLVPTGLWSLRLPERRSKKAVAWAVPSEPRMQLKKQLWEGLAGDCFPGFVLGMGVAVFYMGLRIFVRPLEDSTSYGVGFVGDMAVMLLGCMALTTPIFRRSLPHRSVKGGGGFLAAYKVLPLPGWLVLRRMVMHNAIVFLLFMSLAVVIVGGVWAATGVRPELSFLLLGVCYAAPITWSSIIAEGAGKTLQMGFVLGLGLFGGALLMHAVPSLLIDWDPWVMGMACVGGLMGLIAAILPIGLLFPPTSSRVTA